MVDIKCEVNGSDISDNLKKYFTSITIVDNDGTESDELSIVLTNNIKRPLHGDKIKLWINGVLYGQFLVQNTQTNHLNELNIIATGANFSSNLKVKKTKSFLNTTLGKIVEGIAKEHGLSFRVDFQDTEITHLIQEKESDLHFLNRLSKQYDSIFSIKNSTLIFLDRDTELPTFTIDLNKCFSWSIAHTNRKAYNSCTVFFRSTKENQQISVTTGAGEPVLIKNGTFKTEDEALMYAKRQLQKSIRGTKEGTLIKQGEYVSAGSKLTLANSLQDNGEYTIKTVHTSIDRNGYIIEVDFKN